MSEYRKKLTPKRVKIQYYKKFPPNTKRVARPSKFGNPFPLSDHSLERSLELYREWLDEKLELDPNFLNELKGYNLGCYCKLENDCHADIILEKLYGADLDESRRNYKRRMQESN